MVRSPVPAGRWFGTDTATGSKCCSPYIVCPFQLDPLGRVGQQYQHAKYYKAKSPAVSNDSGQQGLSARGVRNLWIKKSRRKMVSRLKIPTCKAGSLLKPGRANGDNRLVYGVNGIAEVRRRKKCFSVLQSSYLL